LCPTPQAREACDGGQRGEFAAGGKDREEIVTLVGCIEYDWMSRDQMSALSLAAGYAGSPRRDRLADAAGAFLTKTFGGRPFSALEVAELGEMTTRVIAAQAIVAGRPDPRSRATVRKYFGPV
jgi:hypothetical protein